jgi:peptide/nickel transport system ATP-binding protein
MMSTARSGPPIVEVRHLSKVYRIAKTRGADSARHSAIGRSLAAVNDVSFTIREAEAVALVGESGSGKSTVARCLAALLEPTDGEILLNGQAVHLKTPWARKRYWQQVQMVFQDPFSSLNPVQSVERQLARPLLNYRKARRGASLHHELERLLETVQLSPPEQFLSKLPHELSGGQRQRVAVARALAPGPKVLLADEPVSMLDVSIRLGLLNLLRELKRSEKLALLYITHDIASARYFSERILVMYRGEIVEAGPAEAICHEPAHPYTRLLLAAAPDPLRRGQLRGRARPRGADEGSGGCGFAPRCEFATAACRKERPQELVVGSGHVARCVRIGEIQLELARKGEASS